MVHLQLLDLPEEILCIILEYAHSPPSPLRLSPLITCHTLYRIGLPILYHTLLLLPTDLIQRTLLEHPTFVRHVRNVYSSPLTKTSRLLPVLRAIGLAKGSLQTVDFFLDNSWMRPYCGENFAEDHPFAAVSVRRLVVRQANKSYLRRDCVLAVANTLAQAVECWPNLEIMDIGPRRLLSPVTQGQPSPLAVALSHSPSLRLVRTALPPTWNPSLLAISENPNLKRIVLTRSRVRSSPKGIISSNEELSMTSFQALKDHPWLVEAQKHQRLMELVCATPTPDDHTFDDPLDKKLSAKGEGGRKAEVHDA